MSRQHEYVMSFPSGSSMGLELEPVIISINPPKQIGCRVKDYYFGTDFVEGIMLSDGSNHWTKEYLMGNVNVGDVICKVDDERVVSKSFPEILSLLRNLKNLGTSHVVTFRNISAHCKFLISFLRWLVNSINPFLSKRNRRGWRGRGNSIDCHFSRCIPIFSGFLQTIHSYKCYQA